MAKKADKKLVASNKAFLDQHRLALLAVWAVFILFNYVFGFSNIRISDINFLIITMGVEVGIAYFLHNAAQPKISATGEILYGGQDMSAAGLVEYLRDILYIVMASQLLSLLSTTYAWYLLFLVPLLGAWILYSTIIKPMTGR